MTFRTVGKSNLLAPQNNRSVEDIAVENFNGSTGEDTLLASGSETEDESNKLDHTLDSDDNFEDNVKADETNDENEELQR